MHPTIILNVVALVVLILLTKHIAHTPWPEELHTVPCCSEQQYSVHQATLQFSAISDKWVCSDALYPNAQVTNVELVIRITRLFWIVFLLMSCIIPPGCTHRWLHTAREIYTGLVIFVTAVYLMVWVYALPTWCEDAHHEVGYYMVQYFPIDTVLFLIIYILFFLPFCTTECIAGIKHWRAYCSSKPEPASFPI
jgi:hypothetical protein